MPRLPTRFLPHSNRTHLLKEMCVCVCMSKLPMFEVFLFLSSFRNSDYSEPWLPHRKSWVGDDVVT